eukprot:CAMPEP_0194752494 /NCGR_PEP_ID=MMETSP0323_2-20130528/6294_1 /TAXON_ID=2866 ORGANISM="Crypthecodinium cohnii, Strain Seligo" /NCGR_SAMPLE_ID=MMETSP0323_2 /ASSEMBLY_ACC=CAM_ASM_000346 /LENGTH=72 /DNA_ID=CAMNT_0039669467 /DNA_START=85 /DNA_END=300 /DNA_ORIENTATION=+
MSLITGNSANRNAGERPIQIMQEVKFQTPVDPAHRDAGHRMATLRLLQSSCPLGTGEINIVVVVVPLQNALC